MTLLLCRLEWRRNSSAARRRLQVATAVAGVRPVLPRPEGGTTWGEPPRPCTIFSPRRVDIIDYCTGICYVSHILAHLRGRLRRRAEGGAGSGVLRSRLVTVGPGRPGTRPPGTTTWLRGARCTDPEEMPEKEARPPAQNRHGGAPRGERVPLDARRASPGADRRASRARQQKTCAFRRSARPSWGGWNRGKAKSGRSNAPRERRRLRCLRL